MAKEVLITGSSRGIGKACAIYLAKNGFDIVLHCNKNISKAEEVLTEIKEIGVNGRILQFDIKDRQACREAISNDITTHGCYYGTVLNAGIAKDNVFPIMEDEETDEEDLSLEIRSEDVRSENNQDENGAEKAPESEDKTHE